MHPLAETQRYFLAAISKGLETYDITWTCIAVVDRAIFGFFAGESLDLVLAQVEEAAPLVRKSRQRLGQYWYSMPLQMVRSLRGDDLTGTLESPVEGTPVLMNAQMQQSHTQLFAFHFYQLVLAVYKRDTESGMAAARACETHLPCAIGSFLSGMYLFYSAVLFVGNLAQLMPSERTLLQTKIDSIGLWAKTSPTTFKHKHQFLKAMVSKDENDSLDALDAFDEAIYLALENGFIQDSALYAEHCSTWLAFRSQKRSAQYLHFALRQYDFWGANSKTNDISATLSDPSILRGLAIVPSPTFELQNPFVRHGSEDNALQSAFVAREMPRGSMSDRLYRQEPPPLSVHSSSTEGRRNSATTTSSPQRDSDISSELDLQSVMRASLAIQEGPLHVQNIISKLMRIIMQTAGANHGCIMLRGHHNEKNALHIEVIGDENKVQLVDHKPLHSQSHIVPIRLCECAVF
jgi:hypothetical protein